MIENATNLTAQEGMSIGYIKLKTFFSDPSWVGNVLLAFLIGVTIMLYYLNKRVQKCRDFGNNFQRVYDKWLKPDANIKLEYYEEKEELSYPHQGAEWQDFINIVHKQIRRHPLRYRAWALYKKAEKAVGELKSIVTKIASTFIDRCNKEELNFKFEEKWGKKTSDNFVIPKLVALRIDSSPPDEEKGSDGSYILSYGNKKIAKTYSENEKKKLVDLIQSMVEDDEVKELIAKRDQVRNDVEQAKDMYNNKLAKVLNYLRFHSIWGFV